MVALSGGRRWKKLTIRVAVSTQYQRVTDRRTDRQTELPYHCSASSLLTHCIWDLCNVLFWSVETGLIKKCASSSCSGQCIPVLLVRSTYIGLHVAGRSRLWIGPMMTPFQDTLTWRTYWASVCNVGHPAFQRQRRRIFSFMRHVCGQTNLFS